MTLLLDSVILIDHFNGHAAATSYLGRVHAEAAISAITRAEVLAGFDATMAAPARAVLDRLRFIPIGQSEADEAARLRQSHRWKLPDALQAAVAQIHGLQLATRNTRDFDPVRHPFVVVPSTIGG